MSDINAITPVSIQEQNMLVQKLSDGDTSCIERLVESKLQAVADFSQKYRGKGVSFGDLIQEGG